MRACGRWGPACPACGRETQREEAQFRCSGCGHEFQSSYWQDELRSEGATEGGVHSGAEAGAESGKRVRRAPVTFLTVQSRQVLDEFVLPYGEKPCGRQRAIAGSGAGCSTRGRQPVAAVQVAAHVARAHHRARHVLCRRHVPYRGRRRHVPTAPCWRLSC